MAILHPDVYTRDLCAAGPAPHVTWPYPDIVVGVAHAGHRHMVNGPLDHLEESSGEPAGFHTTGRQPALPFTTRHEELVVLDTVHRRALIAVSFLGGEVPMIARTRVGFDELPGMRPLDHRGYWSAGLSFSPEGRRAANIEMHDDGAHLVVLDLRTASRRYITALPGLYGDEPPLWSADGRWILISSHRANLLVDVVGRAIVPVEFDVPCAAATWWPQLGPSMLMLLHGYPGAQQVSSYNLATAERSPITPVRAGTVLPWEERPAAVWRPQMSPDGDRVLVGDTRGTSQEYQHRFGAAQRLAVLDPLRGTVVPLSEPFVGGSMIERSHSRWTWSAPQRQGAAVLIHPRLRQFTREAATREHASSPQVRAQSLWLWDPPASLS